MAFLLCQGCLTSKVVTLLVVCRKFKVTHSNKIPDLAHSDFHLATNSSVAVFETDKLVTLGIIELGSPSSHCR